jgi:hypothetical protein
MKPQGNGMMNKKIAGADCENRELLLLLMASNQPGSQSV